MTINSALPAEYSELANDDPFLAQYAESALAEKEAAAKAQAMEDMGDPDILRELCTEYSGCDPYAALARCFRELDGACDRISISQDAITTALHNLRRDLLAKWEQILREET